MDLNNTISAYNALLEDAKKVHGVMHPLLVQEFLKLDREVDALCRADEHNKAIKTITDFKETTCHTSTK